MSPSEGKRLLRVGLTGNIGSGKSSVARLLEGHGAAVIDADALARQATDDPAVLDEIATALGEDLVRSDERGRRHLDRAATAARVFGDERALQTLNGIVHPWVRARTIQRLKELQDAPSPPALVVQDIPLLYENDLDKGLDAVVVVDAPRATRVERVALRSGLDRLEIERRDQAQLPLSEKVARADFVVDNSGDRAALEEQVALLWRDLLALRERLEE